MRRRPKHDYRIEFWARYPDNDTRNRRYFDDFGSARTAYAHYLLDQVACTRRMDRVELHDACEDGDGSWRWRKLLSSDQHHADLAEAGASARA